MEHTENTPKQGLTVGPVTENLLLSLRALEQAKNYYYCAVEELAGEQAAGDALNETGPKWDAVADVLEKAITDGLRTWAHNAPAINEI